MLRLISFLLILVGGAALAYGGYQYMQTSDTAAKSAPAPAGSVGFYMAMDNDEPPIARSSTPRSSRMKRRSSLRSKSLARM